MTESGTFTHGIEVDGQHYRAFTLEEEIFGHTIEVMNDTSLDRAQLVNPTYYAAALLATRLTVEGIDTVTPEMIIGLSREDGMTLLTLSAELDDRRALCRGEAEAAAQGHAGAAQDGLPGGGDPPQEQG